MRDMDSSIIRTPFLLIVSTIMPADETKSGQSPETDDGQTPDAARRGFVAGACTVGMGGALLASYGTFFSYAGRYLYPSKPPRKGWMYVTQAAVMKVGDSLTYRTPAGAPVAIARQLDNGDVDDFIALSSQCPHLGCAVHWEGQNDRFFCPCHNGVFDPKGNAVSGPPADANQPLPRFPLKLEEGLLYIEVDLDVLPRGSSANQHTSQQSGDQTDDSNANSNANSNGGIA